MKVKHAIMLYVIGLCADGIGAFMKIMHYAQSDMTLFLALTFKTAGCLLFLFKLFTYPAKHDFLNS